MPSGTAQSADFVVVANRLPVDLEKLPDGSQRWKRSPGGLVTALEPMLRSRDGAWVGWPGLPDADVEPLVDPIPLPGAAGPVGGSITGELVDGIDQPIDLPGERPPLSTD